MGDASGITPCNIMLLPVRLPPFTGETQLGTHSTVIFHVK